MSISKNAVKSFVSAALAVVVSGLVAGVSAASPVTSAPGLTPQTGTLDVSYEVKMKAEMVVTPKNLTDNALLIADPSNYQNVGNLGSINVKTNYPLWDVTVTAQNGGYLLGGQTTINNPDGPFGPVPPTILGGQHLKLSGSGNPDAILYLHIGVLNDGGNNFFGNTAITGSALPGAVSFNATLPVATPGTTPVITAGSSFADIIGSSSIAATDTYNGQTIAQIKTSGFNAPKDEELGATFYVSAGLTAPGATPASIGGNPEGVYTETLTFTLVAGW